MEAWGKMTTLATFVSEGTRHGIRSPLRYTGAASFADPGGVPYEDAPPRSRRDWATVNKRKRVGPEPKRNHHTMET